MAEPENVEVLDLATAKGLWRVEGLSGTAYVVDTDLGLALREPAAGAATGPYDRCWMAIVGLASGEGHGVVRLGMRHRWDLDPDPGEPGRSVWWIQTRVTRILALTPEDRPEGREPDAGEIDRPFSTPSDQADGPDPGLPHRAPSTVSD